MKIKNIFIPLSLCCLLCLTPIVSNAVDEENFTIATIATETATESETGTSTQSTISNSIKSFNSQEDIVNAYSSLTASDLSSQWEQQESLLSKIDFSNLSNSVSSYDEDNYSLNYNFSNLLSSLSTYADNSSVDKLDSNSDIFETGYSKSITEYFTSSFGDLSDKKNLDVANLPSMSSYVKKANKERKSLLSSFTSSSDYKKISNAVSISDVFSKAQQGAGSFSLSSISSLNSTLSANSSLVDSKSSNYFSSDKTTAAKAYKEAISSKTYSKDLKKAYTQSYKENKNALSSTTFTNAANALFGGSKGKF